MKKTLILLTFSFLFSNFIVSQDACKPYLPPEGTTLTYVNLDKKGKQTSTTTTEVVSVKNIDGVTFYKVHQLISDGKEKNDMENDFEYQCDGDKFIIDMETVLNGEQMKAFEGGKVVAEVENMYIPNELEEGMELNDGHIKMDVYVEPLTTTITARAFYRKVVGKETVETPAGTFEAWKIDGNIESKFAFMRFAFRVLEWYVEDIGIVKSETYDDKERFVGSTLLQKIEKN
jgi:hypothetical protein